MNEKVKVVFDLDEMWIFYPRLLEYDPKQAIYGRVGHLFENDIVYLDVVHEYKLDEAKTKVVEVDRDLLNDWIRKREDFLTINRIFENKYRKQEGLDK